MGVRNDRHRKIIEVMAKSMYESQALASEASWSFVVNTRTGDYWKRLAVAALNAYERFLS